MTHAIGKMTAQLGKTLLGLAAAELTIGLPPLLLWTFLLLPDYRAKFLVQCGIIAPIAFVCLCIVVVPAQFVMQRLGWNAWYAYVTAGLSVVLAVAAYYIVAMLAYYPLTLIPAGLGLVLGGFSGFVFWLIRRPDKDAPAATPA